MGRASDPADPRDRHQGRPSLRSICNCYPSVSQRGGATATGSPASRPEPLPAIDAERGVAHLARPSRRPEGRRAARARQRPGTDQSRTSGAVLDDLVGEAGHRPGTPAPCASLRPASDLAPAHPMATIVRSFEMEKGRRSPRPGDRWASAEGNGRGAATPGCQPAPHVCTMPGTCKASSSIAEGG
jgi:hypothetical protein